MNAKNKYTFWELCNSYDKIEVPIIQRDYAQGRNTSDVSKLRNKFVNDYLITSVLKEQHVELDFVYGSILTELKDDIKQKTFIPLDGQQRLTTLFLLHYFIAIKEGRLNDVKEILLRFTYETRPSANDFCKKLLNFDEYEELSNIKYEIEDSVWFNEEWNDDPTVSGMLNMLDTFSKNESLLNTPDTLLDKLIGDQSNLVSFYFTDLDQFGLTENLYIRMNARGKMLTDFENFKSEFSKIIRYNHDLLESVKDKIEYDWVNNLWNYKPNNSFVIDQPFMAYLSFVTEMIYFKNAEYRANSYKSNFLDLQILNEVYSNEENLKFLIFSFDFIKEVQNFTENILWNDESLHDVLKNILNNRRDTNQSFLYYMMLRYCYTLSKHQFNSSGLLDFLRVVRNLVENTDDNSRREWPRMIESLEKLISVDSVYSVLINDTSGNNKLIGFRTEQRREEVCKAIIINSNSDYKSFIHAIEDNKNFKGNITNILLAVFSNSIDDFSISNLESHHFSDSDMTVLKQLYSNYNELSKNDFVSIWGDLLVTELYMQTIESRLIFSENYKKHPEILLFTKKFWLSNQDLESYLIFIQKNFVQNLCQGNENLEETRNVKEQLYLYYIIYKRILGLEHSNFFKHGNYNFGWLAQAEGYQSLYTRGIDGCVYFPNSNPIFQVYNQQFRYNLGLNPNYTLRIEKNDGVEQDDLFNKLKNWANSNS